MSGHRRLFNACALVDVRITLVDVSITLVDVSITLVDVSSRNRKIAKAFGFVDSENFGALKIPRT